MTNQISGISSMATRQILADLAALYEQMTNVRVAIRSMGGVEAVRLVRAGEPGDLVVLASRVMEQLEAEGHIASGSRVSFARSSVAMAVRSGAVRPSIDDEDAVRRAILGAHRICYSTGPSGDHLMQLLERWGMAEVISQRLLQAPPGVAVGTIIARGDADLGVQQFSELLPVPGIEILGLLPPEIEGVTVFTVGISALSPQADEAHAFTDFLNSPGAEAAKRRHGMEPV